MTAPSEDQPPRYHDEPPAQVASGPLGEVQKAWPKLLTLIKQKHKPTIAALLVEGKPVALEGDTLTVTFAPDHPYHYEQLSDRDRLDFVESCLEEVLGRKVSIKLQGGRPAKTSEGDNSVSTGRAGKGTDIPGVKRAVEIFGGRVMKEE